MCIVVIDVNREKWDLLGGCRSGENCFFFYILDIGYMYFKFIILNLWVKGILFEYLGFIIVVFILLDCIKLWMIGFGSFSLYGEVSWWLG